jgi:hypothetical protein
MEKLDLPADLRRLERFIGFTIPREGRFYVCDHDEIVRLDIGESISADPSDQHPYKFVENNNDFLGLVFEGEVKNQPILRVGSTVISYEFDPTNDFVVVAYEAGESLGTVEFPTFSGDWFAASLSDDGKHLVLAEPYSIALYRVG